ncbi:BQ2448_1072 [Microbotryum intermedium]|uniref:BQ2448_1072 protein n=1 Tax=Microbotryum intermedium TaxID=269621 RepID=A0A238FEX0_9BASI|nr:BQ2448_1072 [Microbotryum intermedium]
MLFKVSAALVLGLLSIASSASPKKAAIERGQQQAVNNIPTVGSTAVTLLPLDRETVGAGKLFRMRTIGFERADLRTYGLDVILKTANGLNTLTLAQDLASNNASGDNEFDVIFRAPSVFNIRRSEVGQNILANVSTSLHLKNI